MADRHLKTTSALLPLNPILNSNGLLTVGGKDRATLLSPFHRNIRLSSMERILSCIYLFDPSILSMLHAGTTLLLTTLDRTLHIIGARRLVRTITRSCITCRRVSAHTEQHMMGQLPPHDSLLHLHSLLQASILRAHLPSSEDTQGSQSSSRHMSACSYASLPICFSTKAVHLEVMSDLNTVAFTASLHRFISQRGLPTEIHSDKGTNFVGTANDLKDLYHFFSNDSTQKTLSTALSNRCITWHFIQKKSPSFWRALGSCS